MRRTSLGGPVLAAALAVFACAGPARAEEARGRLSAWQEMVFFAVAKAHHAATHCGFKVDPGQVRALLGSAAIGEGDIPPEALSAAMKRQIAADADLYLGDRDAACRRAWERFGSDGAPGLRDLLSR